MPRDEITPSQGRRRTRRPKGRPRTGRRLFAFDRSLGCRYVAGADEAGRGSRARPPVAAGGVFGLRRGGQVAREGTLCLVDGFRLPQLELEQRAVIDGDCRSAAIAAASVLAKVTRDRYMRRAAELHPDWEFEANVGYSTPEHRAAIAVNGISPLHRLSFASIAYQ